MSKTISIGECYRHADTPWSEWRVTRIYRDPLGVPHAILTSMSDETVSRTLACATLGDRRRYQPLAEKPAACWGLTPFERGETRLNA